MSSNAELRRAYIESAHGESYLRISQTPVELQDLAIRGEVIVQRFVIQNADPDRTRTVVLLFLESQFSQTALKNKLTRKIILIDDTLSVIAVRTA